MTNIVDLERYPLDRLNSPAGQALVTRCQAMLERDGTFNLDGLIHPESLGQIVEELLPVIESSAFTHRRRHNVYFLPQVEGLDSGHPAVTELETANHTVCADQIPDSALVSSTDGRHWQNFWQPLCKKQRFIPWMIHSRVST